MTGKLMAIALAVLLAGCSFFMSTVPKNWDGATTPKCSDDGTAPGVDLVVGTVVLVAAGAGIVSEARCKNDLCGMPGMSELDYVPVIIILGLPYLLSGIRGRGNVSRCRSAQRQYRPWERRRAPPVSPRRHQPMHVICAETIDEWREENDPLRKNKLFGEMPEVCRKLAKPKAKP